MTSESFVIPPEHLILGRSGPEVRISGRVAAFLERHANLAQFRRDIRGRDRELDAALTALGFAAAEWRSTATGTRRAGPPEPETPSKWLSTTQAATQLHITDRAVRKAIDEERLAATKTDGRWRINAEDLAHYREGHAA